MGISRATIKLLMREAKRERFCGNALTIGRQDIFATSKDIQEYAKRMDFQLKLGTKTIISDKEGLSQQSYIVDKTLFQSLGFDFIDSMDYNSYEKCTILHDLNKDVPNELHNKYDLIFDGGSSEHIFNVPKVWENYNKMLKVGGRIIHLLPSSNRVDHGFYMFSPTLFYDYYSSNKWNILELLIIKSTKRPNIDLWNIYQYVPGCLDKHSNGGLNGVYGVYFVAKKTNESTFDAPVQQESYSKLWNNTTSTEINNSSWERTINKIPANIKDILRPLYDRFIPIIPRRFDLELIARY